MTLAEAMRQGAALRPQAFRVFFWPGDDGRLRSCALGAAYEALTGRCALPWAVLKRLEPEFPELGVEVECPLCPKLRAARLVLVSHLNDKHGWSRERIADWLESAAEAQAKAA